MRFYETIIKYPKVTIGIILLITLFFGWHARKVELNNSVEALLPEHHPSVLQDKEIKHAFNSREMLLIGVINDKGIFKPSFRISFRVHSNHINFLIFGNHFHKQAAGISGPE